MSSISGIKPQSVQPMPQPQKVGGDADGDNDGTKAAAPVAPVPQVSKPTATLGIHRSSTPRTPNASNFSSEHFNFLMGQLSNESLFYEKGRKSSKTAMLVWVLPPTEN